MGILRRRPPRQLLVQLASVRAATQDGVKARLCRPGGLAHGGFETSPFVVSSDAQRDPSIRALARIDVVWRLPQMSCAETRSRDAALRFEDRGRDARHPCFVHAEIDAPALARLATLVQGQQQGIGHVEATGVVHVVAARAYGRPTLVAGEGGEATDGVYSARPRSIRPPRAGVAVGGTAQGDDIGLDFDQAVVIQTQTPHGTRAKVVSHDVTLGHEFEKHLLAQGVGHLQAEALLIARPVAERTAFVPPLIAGLPIRKGTGAPIIHVLRTLDPDDLGAKVGQEGCAPWENVYLLEG